MKTTIRHIISLLLCLTTLFVSAQEHQVTVRASECAAAQTYSLPDGASLTLKATPANDSRFVSWSDGNTDNPRTVIITGDTSFTACFAHNGDLSSADKHQVTIYAGDCTNPFVGEFSHGALLKIVPDPMTGYQFKQWSDGNSENPRYVSVTSDIELHAEYEIYVSHETLYDVTVIADGCGTSFNHQFYGGTPLVLNATPEVGSVFVQWSDDNTDNPRNVTVTSDITYTAVFAKQKFLISFVNYDGTPLQSGEIEYGTTPSYTGDTPAKPSDAQYTYTFAGWMPEITAVTGDVTYTATFTQETIHYTLTVSAGAHGSVNEEVNGTYTAGTEVMTEATPDRFYVFDRWSDGSQDNPRAVTMDADKTLTASFRIADVIELEDNHKADDSWWTDYANLVTSLGDTKKDVRYLRDLPTGKWCVFALPFDYSFRSGNTLKGGVYEMYRADYTDEGQLFLYFAPVTTRIAANRPYLYRSSTGHNNPEFADVELQAVADGSYSVDNTNTTVGGAVTIHNTMAAMLLAKDKSVIYLDNNRLYYPNPTPGTDTWMRAFRGYFTLDGMSIYHIAPRVRIVVEGETVTELEVVSEDGAEADTAVRKYMENGILVIERNGVRYDATGARLN